MDFLSSFTEDSIPQWYRVLYSGIMLALCIFSFFYIKKVKLPLEEKRRRSIGFLVFFIFFSIGYCVNSDYFNYRNWVIWASRWYDSDASVALYQSLAYWCNGNYDLFRFVVWGGGLILVYISSRKLHIDSFTTLLILFVFYCTYFCYARASLAMAVYWFGVVFFVTTSSKSIIKKIIGIILIFSSIIFHREMIVPVLCLPFMFVSFSRKYAIAYIIVILVVIALAFVVFRDNIGVFGNFYLDKMAKYEEQMMYGEMMWQQRNWNGLLKTYIGYMLYLIPIAVISLKIFSTKNITSVSQSTIRIHRVALGIVISALAIYIVYGGETVFFYRTLYTTQIPIALLSTELFSQRNIGKRSLLLMLFIAFIFNVMGFVSIING